MPVKASNERPSPEVVYDTVNVLPGDSIQRIARRVFGDSSRWRELVVLNSLPTREVVVSGNAVTYVHIVPGQSLKIPKMELVKND